jgi:hypothetical protein
MATTTNYSWTTPDDTALVKDGAAAIRSLGTAIDTTTKALNPSTTLGDIEYRSSTANTNTRLALGTAGQVLRVNSGATAPEWAAPSAGSFTKVTSASFTNVASVDVDGCFTSTYKRYLVQIKSFAATTADDFQLQWRESGITKTSGYTGSGYGIDRSNSTEAYGYISAGQITLSTTSAVSNSVAGSYSFYVDNVGTGSSLGARLWGNGFQSDNAQQSLWFGGGGVAVIATGFRLKSAASNITGEYAVYGLEN